MFRVSLGLPIPAAEVDSCAPFLKVRAPPATRALSVSQHTSVVSLAIRALRRLCVPDAPLYNFFFLSFLIQGWLSSYGFGLPSVGPLVLHAGLGLAVVLFGAYMAVDFAMSTSSATTKSEHHAGDKH